MILFDLPIYQFILSIFVPTAFMTTLMKVITSFGSTLVIATGIICIAILIKDKRYFKIFFLATFLGMVLNNVIKLIVHRPRPVDTMLFSFEKTYSFPSGHSMLSMIFYGLLIYYSIKFIKNKFVRVSLVAFLCMIIFFVGISRIYLGVHYATDVLAGFVFGFIYLVCFIKFLNRSKVQN